MTAAQPQVAAGRSLAGVLRAARLSADLGVRELAAVLGVSPATVSDAETGHDVRRSTLLAYLAHLPSLSPHDLIGTGPPPVPAASPAAWGFVRDLFGFVIERLRFEVVLAQDGRRQTTLEARGVRPVRGDLRDAATRGRVLHLLFRGSPSVRSAFVAAGAAWDATRALNAPGVRTSKVRGRTEAGPVPAASVVADGCFRHELRLPARMERSGLAYVRRQEPDEEPPPGFASPGGLGVSAPFSAGVALPIEHAVLSLELVVRFAGRVPRGARCGVWTPLQPMPVDEPDIAPFLHPEGIPLASSPARRELSCVVTRPVFGLHYGLGWDAPPSDDPPRGKARRSASAGAAGSASVRAGSARSNDSLGGVLETAREARGLSQRELAALLHVSPATVAGVLRGQDVRASFLQACLTALPGVLPADLLPAGASEGPMSRRAVWELQRRVLGIEADEERKTLHVTSEGDAHAVCETIGLRRVRPSDADLRIRYSSVHAQGRRLPTVLKAIEEALAARAEDSGLKARIVSRSEGRLIHEIRVPRDQAHVGVSYSRRLFDGAFFDAKGEPIGGPPRHDGAAIVPYHPAKKIHLAVTLPAGRWPERAWFAAHPRMLIDGPLEDADLLPALHPEGADLVHDASTRTLSLTVDYPLPGFMYDIFWER